MDALKKTVNDASTFVSRAVQVKEGGKMRRKRRNRRRRKRKKRRRRRRK